MSGALASTSTNFQQQGSVDWVELSGRSVQFSVAVLARLSKAGIDPFTLQVGRAICTNFSLRPVAQGRISDAILALKKFGSYGDIIWFGFGVKHVVTDLAETEQGLTLVAVCAALSVTYDSLYGARVLRELCGLCKAPQSFSPAIRQWKILVESCAGILTSGHFVLVLDGFRRLVSGGPDLQPDRHPTTYLALAEGILTIAQVTTKRLASATFTGGLDCMWLAAVAEWVFSLDVVIYNSAGVLLYRSRSLDEQPPQVTVVYIKETAKWEKQILVSEKTTLIRSGRTLFVREDDKSLGDPHFFNWRSSWSTILHDTFPRGVDELLTGENAYQFGLYLYCVSMVIEPDMRHEGEQARLFSENFLDPLLWTQESSRGHKFLSYASNRLPELGCCLENDFSSVPQDELIRYGLDARERIENCDHHLVHRNLPRSRDTVCLVRLAQVILHFLWLTLVSEIDEEIAPSITGLRNLYTWLDEDAEPFAALIVDENPDYKIARQTALVFHVLSGLAIDSGDHVLNTLSKKYLAMAGSGVCVYRQALADPNLPPNLISKFRVVTGYVSHDGAIFKRIIDLPVWKKKTTFSFDALSTCRSVDAIVQETDRDSELAMAYQVDYVDSQGQRKYLFLNLERLFSLLERNLVTFKCEGDCSDLPTKSQQNVDGPNMNKAISSSQNTRKHPVVLFDQAAAGNAECLIADLKRLSNMWVLTSMSFRDEKSFHQNPGLKNWPVKMLIDRPFVIYLSLMDYTRTSLCLFSFTPCLSCMIEHGFSTRVRALIGKMPSAPSAGLLTLLAPGSTGVEIPWETLNPEK